MNLSHKAIVTNGYSKENRIAPPLKEKPSPTDSGASIR